MELSAIPFLCRSPDFVRTPTFHCLTSWLDAFNSGLAYNDALDVYIADDSGNTCLDGYSHDGFWLGGEVESLVPSVDSLDGELFDFLPTIAAPTDYQNLPMPILLLAH
jgi:hypothetical protein